MGEGLLTLFGLIFVTDTIKSVINMDMNEKKFHTGNQGESESPEDCGKKVNTDGFPSEESGDDSEVQVETVEDPSNATDRTSDLEKALEKEKKEYMFLLAEFDNFRKRTLKEKSEIIRNAGENVLKGLLPILDDFERGIEASRKDESASSALEGMELIYNKLKKYLEQNGVKEMDPADRDFDTEKHEAISVVPAVSDDQKGKIIDTVQKGYMINDKVLRHAKVVVGQ